MRDLNDELFRKLGREGFLNWYYGEATDVSKFDGIDDKTIIVTLSKWPNALQKKLIRINKEVNGHVGSQAPVSPTSGVARRDRDAYVSGYATAKLMPVSSIALIETTRRLSIFKQYVDQVAGIGKATDVRDYRGRQLRRDSEDPSLPPSTSFIRRVLSSQWIKHVKIWFRSGRGDGSTTNCNKAAASLLQASINAECDMPYAHFQLIDSNNSFEFGSKARMRIHDPLLFGQIKEYLIQQVKDADVDDIMPQRQLLVRLMLANSWVKLANALKLAEGELDRIADPSADVQHFLEEVKNFSKMLTEVRIGEMSLDFLYQSDARPGM